MDESRDLDIVTKEHSEDMTSTEFVQWLDTNFGSIGVRQALADAAFLLCCEVIAQDIAKAPLRLREWLDNGTSKVVSPTKHEVAALLAADPNRRHTWYEFKEMLALWHCLTKNAFAGVFRDRSGTALELVPFQTYRIREKVEGRDVFYDVMASTMQEQALLGAAMHTFHERDMIHVRGRMLDGMDGYSTIRAGEKTLETGEAIEEFRNNLFAEDGQVRGVFSKPGEALEDEKAFQRLRDQLRILMSRFKTGTEPIVLEGGMDFKPISSKPSEMELTKQFQAQILATCRLLRVPPHKVFEMEGAKYENLETQEKMYVGDTLVPIAQQFEQRYSRALLIGKDRSRFFLEHDRDAMTLRDTKAETERVIKATERGIIEVDEARARLGYNPLPDKQGQVRLIPVNMNVVGRDGEVLIGATGDEPASEEKPEDGTEIPEGEESKARSAPALRLIASA